MIRIFQAITPNPDDRNKVTTRIYSYAFFIDANSDTEPFVRYDYVPQTAAADPTYRYPIGHVHIHATSDRYDSYIASFENKSLKDVHFPSGRISVEDFIELLIVEFHVPVVSGDEQAAIQLLRKSRDEFRQDKQTQY